MSPLVKELSVDELREVIQDSVRQAVEDEIEDLRALASPDFVQSIEEARQDYRAGRFTPLEDLLDG